MILLEKIDGVIVTQEHFSFFKEFEYKGKSIFFLDLSDMKPEEVIESVPKTEKLVRSRPEKSVLFLTDMKGMRYTSESLDVAKNYTKGNEAVIKKSALLGIDGLKKIAISSMIKFSGRKNLKVAGSIEEALEWLIAE